MTTDAELIAFLKQEADAALEQEDGEMVAVWYLAAADRLAKLVDENKKLSAEVKRLRAALRHLGGRYDSCDFWN